MSIWRHAEWIHPVCQQSRITLGEGDTPLIRSRRIGPRAGLANLMLKIETGNPTGSYKDRFAAVAVSDMLARHKTRCLATSSGNTGAALAAYCAAGGIACHIAVVETAPREKLAQMLAYGAQLLRVRGFGKDAEITQRCFELLSGIASGPEASLQISAFAFSPEGMSGVRSISHELAQQSRQPIGHVFCPAGGGGLTLAVAEGFQQLVAAGLLPRGPAIECVQPWGNNTIAGPLREGSIQARAVRCTSGISGLQVPSVIDGDAVIGACRRSGGSGHVVRDDAIWEAQRRLAAEEGIFCEPAGAAGLAGALQAARQGEISRQAAVVCLVTGSGFKDPDSVGRMTGDAPCPSVSVGELRERLKE